MLVIMMLSEQLSLICMLSFQVQIAIINMKIQQSMWRSPETFRIIYFKLLFHISAPFLGTTKKDIVTSSVQSHASGFILKEADIYSTGSQNTTVPGSYLMIFEVSSSCESLHRGLAIIRHASAESTYSSRLDSNHLVNYVGNAVVDLF